MLVVKYCTLAQRHQLLCIFDPFSPEDLFQRSQRLGQCMSALFLRAVVIGGRQSNLRRRPLPSTCGCMPSARVASTWFRPPSFELGLSSCASKCLRQTSPTVMLRRVAGLSFMRHDVLNVGLSTPHLSLSPCAPMISMLDVIVSSGTCIWVGLDMVSLSDRHSATYSCR